MYSRSRFVHRSVASRRHTWSKVYYTDRCFCTSVCFRSLPQLSSANAALCTFEVSVMVRNIPVFVHIRVAFRSTAHKYTGASYRGVFVHVECNLTEQLVCCATATRNAITQPAAPCVRFRQVILSVRCTEKLQTSVKIRPKLWQLAS